jgi:hypothetical protein
MEPLRVAVVYETDETEEVVTEGTDGSIAVHISAFIGAAASFVPSEEEVMEYQF